jgi:hypothetical protein
MGGRLRFAHVLSLAFMRRCVAPQLPLSVYGQSPVTTAIADKR